VAEERRAHEVAFVLGGGGVLGAHEVGMLQALAEAGVRPDLVLGTSVGALNGVFVAAHDDPGAAVPGLLPPVRVGDEHFFDGGLVHSIPVGRALELGARTVYVLHVGRIEQPLQPPTRPWEVGLVAFEIARRYRFAEDMAAIPPGVTVHVLPAGNEAQAGVDLSQLRYRDTSRIDDNIRRAYEASAAYLAGVAGRPTGTG
jgi:predicted acylesterase/phospholipase RssA